MSTSDTTMLPGETIQYEGKMHPVVFVKGLITALFAVLFIHARGCEWFDHFLFGLAAFFLFIAYVNFTTSRFIVTNKRVIISWTGQTDASLDLFYAQIESVRVDQGIFGSIGNFGKVIVRGTGGTTEGFKFIAAPLNLRHQIHKVTAQHT
jgi:hypothetical protein